MMLHWMWGSWTKIDLNVYRQAADKVEQYEEMGELLGEFSLRGFDHKWCHVAKGGEISKNSL